MGLLDDTAGFLSAAADFFRPRPLDHLPQPMRTLGDALDRRPFGWGSAAYGTQTPQEEAEIAPSVLDVIARSQMKRLAAAVSLPGDVYDGKVRMPPLGAAQPSDEMTGRVLDLAGLMMTGSAGAPPGSITAGFGRPPPRSPSLSMAPEARLARAKEMGFRTDMPVYHGTGSEFSEFRAVPTSAGPMDTPGVSVALSPEIANEFAAARGSGPASPQVYPLYHRADRPVGLTLSGHEAHHEVVATLQNAFDRRYDSVLLRNYTSPGGIKGNIIIVKDGNQLRSVNAAFDPARRADRNLLYSIAPVAGAAFAPFALSSVDRDP